MLSVHSAPACGGKVVPIGIKGGRPRRFRGEGIALADDEYKNHRYGIGVERTAGNQQPAAAPCVNTAAR